MTLRAYSNLKFHLKVRNTQYNRNILQINCIRYERNDVILLYHTENGVYGYRPKKQQKHFEGI